MPVYVSKHNLIYAPDAIGQLPSDPQPLLVREPNTNEPPQMDSFDFSYIGSLPTERVGLARMTISPVLETKSRPAIVFVHGNMQGAWIYSNWLKVVHEAGIAATAVDVRGRQRKIC